MTSPERRMPTRDTPRETDKKDHLHLGPGAPPLSSTHDIDQQIFELKQEQELQKQLLIQKFQQKTKELELQHKRQLETKYQYAVHSHGALQELRERERLAFEEQEREKRDREPFKRKENCSANASPEVKQILSSFLLNRKQATSSNGIGATSPYRNRGVVKSASGESLPAGTITSSHPYKIPQPPPALLKYESDFPLRKTASEPNMLKIRLKQSVIERKARIIGAAGVRRQERLLQRRQHKQSPVLTNCNSSADSGPNSPPSSLSGNIMGSRGSPTSAPIQEENEESLQYQPGQRSSINDLALFSSPSLPNISLGRPNAQATIGNYAMLAALRQHGLPPLGSAPPTSFYNNLVVPLGRQHQLPPSSTVTQNAAVMGPQPAPVARSASATSKSPSQVSLFTSDLTPPQAHAASLALTSLMHVNSSGVISGIPSASAGGQSTYGQPITDAQVALAHLNKQGHRPLGRTQSAPLPLGHPMLTGTGQVNIVQTHYENSDAERQAYEHSLLTQKIRQTVLNRASGRELHLKEEDDSAEVMDLTDKKKPPKTVITCTVPTSTSQTLPESGMATQPYALSRSNKIRDQDYLQLQRERLYIRSIHMDHVAASKGVIRPLSRTLSSPLVHSGSQGLSYIPDSGQYASPIVTSSSADHIPPVNLTMPHKRHLLEYPIYKSPSPPQLIDRVVSTSINSLSKKINNNNTTLVIAQSQKPKLSEHKLTTGLAYDGLMLKHSCRCDNNALHPEHSGRLQSIWARLNETDLAKRCDRLHSRKATLEELQSVHTEAHTNLFGSNHGQLSRFKIDNPASFVRLQCGGIGVDLDTTWIEHHTAMAARMAAGCVIDLAFKTAKGDIKNGFAVVRPPGHHAEANLAMGFCFFNSVAIAAKLLRLRMPEMKRILIIDWDVHHGNGTQQAFFDSPDVLYLSIHRHDDGNFFPGTGGPTECGSGPGLGFNINISWSGGLNPPLGDAEYIAAFRTVVIPIAKSFNPDIILVSAGFDAAIGHPSTLGGYLVSPACFGYMTRELMQLANGKIVLALEGGYDLTAICDSAQECVKALLDDTLAPIAENELNRVPCQSAISTLQKTIAIQLQYWPCLRRLLNTVGLSAMDAMKFEHDESETVNAMAGLSMQSLHRARSSEDSEEPMDQDETK